MGMLSKAIKSDVLTENTRYKAGQEKIGEIIEFNEDTRTCTVALTTRDGINSVIYNVACQLDYEGNKIPWDPKPGDLVKVTEQYKQLPNSLEEAKRITKNSSFINSVLPASLIAAYCK